MHEEEDGERIDDEGSDDAVDGRDAALEDVCDGSSACPCDDGRDAVEWSLVILEIEPAADYEEVGCEDCADGWQGGVEN